MKKNIYQQPKLTIICIRTRSNLLVDSLHNEVSTNTEYVKSASGNGRWDSSQSVWDEDWSQ
ncbi:MAG: hypothetical protein IJT75_10410 [Bacteroidaceae bacterium]|nr:hypothetical protein [Bacteroidaceae bacterium]